MSACEFMQESLSAYFDGEATPEERLAISAHLDTCASCHTTVDDWVAISMALPSEAASNLRGASERALRHRVGRRRRVMAGVAAVLATGLASSVATVVRTNVVGSAPVRSSSGREIPAESPFAAGSPSPLASSSEGAAPRSPAAGVVSPVPSVQGPFACSDAGRRRTTDTGVTADTITLGAPIVTSGTDAVFYGEVRDGLEAMTQQINAGGGICGRRIVIEYAERAQSSSSSLIDGGMQQSSQQQSSIDALADRVFAIVSPDPEALRSALSSGVLDSKAIPVVGSFGSVAGEFDSQWVWPLGADPRSFAAAVVNARARIGDRSFGVIFDKAWPEFGQAVNSEVRRSTAHGIQGFNTWNECARRYCPIDAEAPYTTEAHEYYSAPVATTILAVSPNLTPIWMQEPSAAVADPETHAAPSHLFSRAFAEVCQRRCDGMTIWTPIDPPVAPTSAAVSHYVQSLRRTEPSADVYNVFTETAYAGMNMLAQALARAGTDLTRVKLKNILSTQPFETGLTGTIDYRWSRWVGVSGHAGIHCLRPFAIKYKGTFGGWSRLSQSRCSKYR